MTSYHLLLAFLVWSAADTDESIGETQRYLHHFVPGEEKGNIKEAYTFVFYDQYVIVSNAS